MLTTVQGRYHDGAIQLDELPPNLNHSRVIVTFLAEQPSAQESNRSLGLAADRRKPLQTEFIAPLPE